MGENWPEIGEVQEPMDRFDEWQQEVINGHTRLGHREWLRDYEKIHAADLDRSYVVGVPLVVNVQPDGAVFLEVDLSEVSGNLGEHVEIGAIPDAQIEADDTLVAAACDRIRNSITHRIA